MLIVLLAALITIALSLRTVTGRRFWGGQLLDPNLDQFNRSTFFTGDPTGVSPWTRASVAHRISVRVAIVGLLFLYIIGLFTHPYLTLAVCVTFAAAVTAWWAWQGWRHFTTRDVRRMKKALFAGLQRTVGWNDVDRPGEVIHALNDYQTSGITLLLPDNFQRLDTPIEHTEQIASRTLGGEWSADWDLIGEPTVQLQHAPPPPDQVTWADIEHYLTAINPSQLLLGLGSRSRPILIDLDNENPHALLSVPTGGGKSVLAELLGCQILHHGGELIVIDLDRATDWIKQGNQLLPGVTYCRTVEEAHHKLVDLSNIQTARNAAADNDPNYAPHRIVVLIEEANRTAAELNAYWAEQKQEGSSPATRALRGLAFGGRKRRMHLFAISQKGVASIFGTTDGGAAKENLTYRILGSESSAPTWDLLAEIPPASRPEPIKHRGRMFVVDGNTYKTVQVGYLTDEQARAWATSGAANPPAPAKPQAFIGIL